MKIVIRLILTLLTLCSVYFFIYWLPMSIIPGVREIEYLPYIISFVFAVLAAAFVWIKTGNIYGSLVSYVFLGGIITGSVCFFAGFFGPMIFNPKSGQGPLLGLLIAVPCFVVGLIGGAIVWIIRNKKGKFKME